MKIYPNDLCPCGSGKKYKKCCMNKSKNTFDTSKVSMNFEAINMYQTSDNNIYVELTTPSKLHKIQITELAKSFENTHKKSIFKANEKETDDFIQSIIQDSIQNKEIFLEEFEDIKTTYKAGYSIRKTLHPMVKAPLWLVYNSKLSNTREIIKMFFDEYQYPDYTIGLYFFNGGIGGEGIDIVCANTEFIDCICKALELEKSVIKSIGINPMSESYVIGLEQNTKYFESLKTYKYINDTFEITNEVLTTSLSDKDIDKLMEFEIKMLLYNKGIIE